MQAYCFPERVRFRALPDAFRQEDRSDLNRLANGRADNHKLGVVSELVLAPPFKTLFVATE